MRNIAILVGAHAARAYPYGPRCRPVDSMLVSAMNSRCRRTTCSSRRVLLHSGAAECGVSRQS